jgi:PqqD family protein of HPr-rel-A system
LLVEDWVDSYAVYQRASGETHVFNDVTMTLLSCIRHNPASVELLVARVAEELEIPRENAVPSDFLDVVARLEELGLIERMTSDAITT